MDLGIKNKTALITGGSRGLGLASAISLAKEGVNLVICARSKEDLLNAEKTLQQYGVNVTSLVQELSDEKSVTEFYNKVKSNDSQIDILVNNVGGSLGTSSLVKSKLKDFQKVMDINTWVAISLSKIFVEDMISNGWGRIINIASIYGREHGGSAPYMAAKAALIAATKHTAIDLAKTGVTANCIAPGSIKHEKGSWEKFVDNNTEEVVEKFIDQNLPMGKFGYPEAVGDTVAFLASKNSEMILGTCLNVDGGQSNSLF
ncbi:MAG: short-chain dehydrogenase [Chloroflexi bacterium]|nr:short-chain dehydrogenase [Chloroflexota bacterium]MBK90334.1 short-chain dehydrogenase [Chloroflexota bacterium]MBK90715.1 short-chain dehydrogenase [Chloroflexota bacterium]|tara:strand:+ start:28139 stop:28915 length:777 start_codon:yes stop_codon:yes gene_type:complete